MQTSSHCPGRTGSAGHASAATVVATAATLVLHKCAGKPEPVSGFLIINFRRAKLRELAIPFLQQPLL